MTRQLLAAMMIAGAVWISAMGGAHAQSDTAVSPPASVAETDSQRRAFGQWAVQQDAILGRALATFETARQALIQVSVSRGDLSAFERLAEQSVRDLDQAERDYRAIGLPDFPALALGDGAEPAQQAATALGSIGHMRDAVRMFPVMARAERSGDTAAARRSVRTTLRANRALVELQLNAARNLVNSAEPSSVDFYVQRLEMHFFTSLLAVSAIHEARMLGDTIPFDEQHRILSSSIAAIDADSAALQLALRQAKNERDRLGEGNSALIERVDALSGALVRIWTAHAADLRAMQLLLRGADYRMQDFGAQMDRIRATREAADHIYRQQNALIAGS